MMMVPDFLFVGLFGCYMHFINFQLGFDVGLLPCGSMVTIHISVAHFVVSLLKGESNIRGIKGGIGRPLWNSDGISATFGITGKILANATLSLVISYDGGYLLVELFQHYDDNITIPCYLILGMVIEVCLLWFCWIYWFLELKKMGLYLGYSLGLIKLVQSAFKIVVISAIYGGFVFTTTIPLMFFNSKLTKGIL